MSRPDAASGVSASSLYPLAGWRHSLSGATIAISCAHAESEQASTTLTTNRAKAGGNPVFIKSGMFLLSRATSHQLCEEPTLQISCVHSNRPISICRIMGFVVQIRRARQCTMKAAYNGAQVGPAALYDLGAVIFAISLTALIALRALPCALRAKKRKWTSPPSTVWNRRELSSSAPR